jgi:hypothetical protein
MKKISLKDMKKGMSRNEMRIVKGGSGVCGYILSCSRGGFYNHFAGGGGRINCCS